MSFSAAASAAIEEASVVRVKASDKRVQRPDSPSSASRTSGTFSATPTAVVTTPASAPPVPPSALSTSPAPSAIVSAPAEISVPSSSVEQTVPRVAYVPANPLNPVKSKKAHPCGCLEHYDKAIYETSFDIPLELLIEGVYCDVPKPGDFYYDDFVANSCTDIVITKWRPGFGLNEPSNVPEGTRMNEERRDTTPPDLCRNDIQFRDVYNKMPFRNPMTGSVKITRQGQTQRILTFDSGRAVIDTVTMCYDIPYADVFATMIRYCFVSNGPSSTTMTVTADIKWLKSCWVKPFIIGNAVDGVKEHTISTFNSVKTSYLSRPPHRKITSAEPVSLDTTPPDELHGPQYGLVLPMLGIATLPFKLGKCI